VKSAKRPSRQHLLAAARHPARRDGVVALVLFLLPGIVALALRYHLDCATVGILVSISLGLPAAWLTWAGHRDTRRSATQVTGLTIAQVADQLAIAVRAQWEAEAAIRRINDPYPLPVSWAPADASLTEAPRCRVPCRPTRDARQISAT